MGLSCLFQLPPLQGSASLDSRRLTLPLMPALTALDLSATDVDNTDLLRFLPLCPQLRRLGVSRCRAEELSVCSRTLQRLDASRSTRLRCLRLGCPALVHLDVSFCEQLEAVHSADGGGDDDHGGGGGGGSHSDGSGRTTAGGGGATGGADAAAEAAVTATPAVAALRLPALRVVDARNVPAANVIEALRAAAPGSAVVKRTKHAPRNTPYVSQNSRRFPGSGHDPQQLADRTLRRSGGATAAAAAVPAGTPTQMHGSAWKCRRCGADNQADMRRAALVPSGLPAQACDICLCPRGEQ